MLRRCEICQAVDGAAYDSRVAPADVMPTFCTPFWPTWRASLLVSDTAASTGAQSSNDIKIKN